MRDAVQFRSRPLVRWSALCGWLSLSLLWLGCTPAPATKKPVNTKQETPEPQVDSRVQRNLQNAMDSLQPDKLGTSSGAEQAIAVLNEWAIGAKDEAEKRGEGWQPHRPHGLLKSLPAAWSEQVSLEQFIERDAAFLRDSIWASRATRFGAGNAEKDLDVVVNLFDFVVRNVMLIPPGRRRVPLGPFDTMVFGQGTALDRAWVFAELLRQRNVDSVILSPRRAEGEPLNVNQLLVGVLFEKDIYLFDPSLGLPLMADAAEPKSALPRLPLSLRQAQRNPELLVAIAKDSEGQFELTAAMLEALQIELICQSEHLAIRMKRLQNELSGENSAIVADPLEDSEGQPGLWSRVAKHPAATWSAEDVSIWSYPEIVRESAARPTTEQQKELAKLAQSLNAPIRVRQFNMRDENTVEGVEFSRPERALLKRRTEHVVGRWADAVPGYLAAQLYDVDPPTAKTLMMLAPGMKTPEEISVAGSTQTRVLRGVLMQQQYKHVRDLHLQAGDDACFWLALCQYEQNRIESVVDQCNIYNKQHSNGRWFAPSQALMATALAKQNKLKAAVRALKEIEEDDTSIGGYRVLMARWQRLLAAAE